MPLQNRVTPSGELITSQARGTLMGNRGNLHNDNKAVVRKSAHKSWVACQLSFEGIKREVMKPGAYTELFFLDEAIAYSSGHRPCSDCQKAKFKFFKKCWLESNGKLHDMPSTNMSEIDKVLHGERIDQQGGKITFMTNAGELPDGTCIEYEGKNYLKWNKRYLGWSAAGYISAIALPHNLQVTVLTPKSVVRCFMNGLTPEVHISALTL